MATKKRSLGSWFPTASLIKNTSYKADDKICICLFYQYVKPLWIEDRKTAAISYIEKHAEQLNVGGRVRVGTEGLNATISSTPDNIREFTRRLGEFDDHFKTTDFKYMDNLPLDRAFKELKVLPVKELVYYGIHAEEELAEGGVHLEPQEYHQKLGEDNTVVIDVRNAYESDIGRFGAQEKVGGAELLVPDMRKSTDFPSWIEREEVKEKLQGKNVLMYCTGGVRCERASALLKSKYGDTVSGVYQLQGGIEKYLQQFPDGGYWQGKNFVFDKREAIGVGCFEGVGGIVQPTKSSKDSAKVKDGKDGKGTSGGAKDSSASDKDPTAGGANDKDSSASGAKGKAAKETQEAEVLGKCCGCDAPWDRYVGKKKCVMCGVPVLLCVSCSSIKGMLEKADREKGTATNSTTTTTADTADPSADGMTKEGVKLGKRQRIKAAEAAKKRQQEEQLHQRLRVLRCPLCVAENVTVPADQVVFTANGTKAVFLGEESEGGGYFEHSGVGKAKSAEVSSVKAVPASGGAGKVNKKIKFGEDGVSEAEGSVVSAGAGGGGGSAASGSGGSGSGVTVGKAAPTVCKWGGGYSSREEKGKSAKKRKLSHNTAAAAAAADGTVKINRPCKFGSECTRADCWFQH